MQASRPAGLPEFKNPPIDEVVLGVQFDPPTGYQQVFVGEVRNLFKAKMPRVAEQAPLQPSFETFGPPGVQQFQINLNPTVPHSRYWFLSDDEHELIQFQSDRFLRNWREIEGRPRVDYPRFDTLIDRFQKDFSTLTEYFRRFEKKPFTCNQAEVTYINRISPGTIESPDPSAYLKFFGLSKGQIHDFSVNWRRTLYRPDKSPYARLICEVLSAVDSKGKDLIILNLTVRGRPVVGTIGNVLEFMRSARETIVTEFAAITTEAAHELWSRA